MRKQTKAEKRSNTTQLPMFAPESNWRPPSMDELPDWTGAKRIALDTETRDPFLIELGPSVRRGGYITGISFAIEDGPKHYLPIRHQGGDNLDPVQVLNYVRHQAKNYRGEIVGANIGYDLDYLAEEDIEFTPKFFRDIQIAAPLIHELHMSFSFKNIAERLGIAGKDETLLNVAAAAYGVNPKDGMWRLPARFVGPYGEQDAAGLLPILRRQERLIGEKDLWEIYDLESRVTPILIKMRRRGIKIDTDKLAQIEAYSLVEEAKALAEVHRLTGTKIEVGDVWKGDAIADALEAIGFTLPKTKTGKRSTAKDILTGLDHPVGKLIVRARKVNKLRTTFAESIRRYMVNGRIHCSFQQIAAVTESGDQMGARYGRLSCMDPNLQQQPSRDEFANFWRSIYVPEEGRIWACCDYSQQEPRWTTHFSALCNFPGAREAAQAYHDNPDLDNHDFMTTLVFDIIRENDNELFEKKRKAAKDIYLGVCYGEGGAKLSRDLGLPTRWALSLGFGRSREVKFFDTRKEALDAGQDATHRYIWETAGEEGQFIMDKFDARAPFIRQTAKKAEAMAKQRGWVKTIGNRVLNFDQKQDGSYDFTHKAFNRIIQGSSADQMKTAMVEVDREMPETFLQLQVHDELDFSATGPEEAIAVGEIMSNCIPALVPFKVDIEMGPSWGEIKGI